MSQVPATKQVNVEAEVKISCDDLDRLRKSGFELTVVEPRHFEDNWLLDSSNHPLFERGAALRIRSVGDQGWVTYKGVVRDGNSLVKVREEIEIETAAPNRMFELFERLGFRRSFRYQKYRTAYQLAVD